MPNARSTNPHIPYSQQPRDPLAFDHDKREAMEEILPGITKIVVSPEAQSVLILGNEGRLTPVPIGPTP